MAMHRFDAERSARIVALYNLLKSGRVSASAAMAAIELRLKKNEISRDEANSMIETVRQFQAKAMAAAREAAPIARPVAPVVTTPSSGVHRYDPTEAARNAHKARVERAARLETFSKLLRSGKISPEQATQLIAKMVKGGEISRSEMETMAEMVYRFKPKDKTEAVSAPTTPPPGFVNKKDLAPLGDAFRCVICNHPTDHGGDGHPSYESEEEEEDAKAARRAEAVLKYHKKGLA